MRKIVIAVFIQSLVVVALGLSIGCRKISIESYTGNWQNDDRYLETLAPFSTITLTSQTATIVDHQLVEHIFDMNFSQRTATLVNTHENIRLKIESISNDSILINGKPFVKFTPNDRAEMFAVRLFELQAEEMEFFPNQAIASLISVGRYSDGRSGLKLGSKFTDVRDLPLFLDCGHCKLPLPVVLFVDNSIVFSELVDLYAELFYSNVEAVSLVTATSGIDNFSGFHIQICFTESQINSFARDRGYLKRKLPERSTQVEYLKFDQETTMTKYLSALSNNENPLYTEYQLDY